MRYSMKYLAIQFLVQLSQGIDLNFWLPTYHLMINLIIQRVLLLSNTIDLQLFAKFLKFNKNCGKFLVPNDYLSLDDTFYPTRTQISFKQFNPSKPAKYGMLYKSINAFRYPFTFSTAAYPAKPKAEPTSYYTPGMSQTVKYLIQNLECHINLVARSVGSNWPPPPTLPPDIEGKKKPGLNRVKQNSRDAYTLLLFPTFAVVFQRFWWFTKKLERMLDVSEIALW